MHRVFRTALSTAAVLLLAATGTFAADYYVRTDGSDSCDGRSNTAGSSGSCAFRTIGKANSAAGCGDTIHVGTGLFAEGDMNLEGSCAAGNEKVFKGGGQPNTYWMAGLVDVDESTCVQDSHANVYKCRVPSGFTSSAAGNARYCFVQRFTDHVRFLDENNTKGDMVGPVCLTWNTNGASSVSSGEGQVYYDGGQYFYIHSWDGKTPAQADFWAPAAYGFYDGPDGPVDINGNGILIRDLSVISDAFVSISVQGDNSGLEDADVYTGMIWFDGSSAGGSLKDVRILNNYRRPTNNTNDTAWGNTNSQSLSMQGSNFTFENLETYASREGVGMSGCSNGTVDGLFAHGHHNHVLKFISNAHDITLRDVVTYNGQEPIFIACAYNIRFENSSFPFSHIVVQERPDKDCSPQVSNIDVVNSVLCGIHYFDAYGDTWGGGGHDLDYNVYMSDHGACYQNSWLVGAGGQKFGSLGSWQSWDGGSCPTCTRDPNSRTDRVNDTWVSYAYKDDTLGVGYSFDLKEGATAIDAGHTAWGDGFDIDLNPRVGAPDAGAYEGQEGTGGPECGNGVVETGEECDGSDLNGQTCESLGHTAGTLSCTSSCTFDESGCTDPLPPPPPENLHRTDVKS